MSNSFWPHGLQHTRLLNPSPTPGACSKSCPSSQWWKSLCYFLGFPGPPANAADSGSIRGQEDIQEKRMVTHSSIPAWEIPWTEEPGGLQPMGWQRVSHDFVSNNTLFFIVAPLHNYVMYPSWHFWSSFQENKTHWAVAFKEQEDERQNQLRKYGAKLSSGIRELESAVDLRQTKHCNS